jgi:hypothetical protein
MSYLLHYFNVLPFYCPSPLISFSFLSSLFCFPSLCFSFLLLSFLTYFVIPSLFLLSVFLLSAFFYVYIYCNQDCFSQSFSFTSSNSIFFLSIDSLSGKHKFQNGGGAQASQAEGLYSKMRLEKSSFSH